MTVEQRDARDLDDIEIELMEEDGEEPSFRLRQPPQAGVAPQPETPERRVLKALAGARAPLSQRQIRERAATRHKTVGAILQKFVQEERIERNSEGGLQPRRKPARQGRTGRQRQRSRRRAVPGSHRSRLGVRGGTALGNRPATDRQAPATTMRRAIGPWPKAPLTAMDALSRADGGGSPEGPERSAGAA